MNNQKHKWNWKKLQRGRGICVSLEGDVDEYGNQKNRPGIILKTYPSHVKIQLLSTESNWNDYFSIKINNRTQYVRPIYFKTVDFKDITRIWKDDDGKTIELDRNSTFFTKIIEMQYKELFNQELDLTRYQIEKERIAKEQAEKELEI